TAELRARYDAEGLSEHFEEGMMLAGALEGLEATVALALSGSNTRDAPAPLPPDAAEAAAAVQRRAAELRNDLRVLMRAGDPEYVYYVEVRGRGVFLRASPIDVSRLVREALFSRFRTVVLTSATLAVEDSFEYVKGRLGIGESRTLREIGRAHV